MSIDGRMRTCYSLSSMVALADGEAVERLLQVSLAAAGMEDGVGVGVVLEIVRSLTDGDTSLVT
jgi:hypothetical protein